ncbi:MAG TPA: CoA-binding protein [bacterium]
MSGLSILDNFFYPQSIAVIGASSNLQKVGHVVLKNILFGGTSTSDKKEGFKGKVFPVNLREKEILGLKTYKSVKEISDRIDVAVIVVPAKDVLKVTEECGQKGIGSVVIISAGFAESGKAGSSFQTELLSIAKQYGIRIIGPNCLGIISSSENLNLTFARVKPPAGPIAFISQSGALGTAVIEYALEEYFGMSYFVSIGNKSDIDDSDLLEYFAEDSGTKCISLYLESVRDGRRFFNSMKSAAKKKPIVVLKAGITSAGAKAIASHTGSLAGADVAYDAAIRQSGALRARTMYELFDASRALAYQPPVKDGHGIAIVTNAGGPGVIAADDAYKHGLPLATLTEQTIKLITSVCPPTWSRQNPIDIIGDATPQRYRRVLNIVASAPEVGGIIIICSRQALTQIREIVDDMIILSKSIKKPVTVSLVGIVAQEEDRILDKNGIPVTEVPERAVEAMNALFLRGRYLDRLNKSGY